MGGPATAARNLAVAPPRRACRARAQRAAPRVSPVEPRAAPLATADVVIWRLLLCVRVGEGQGGRAGGWGVGVRGADDAHRVAPHHI